MSKESSERGERKRQAIRDIIFSLIDEGVRQHKTSDEIYTLVNKHIKVIEARTKPQELCLLRSVIAEIQYDKDWAKKQIERRSHANTQKMQVA
jgi:hypothetical protein